eukprot:gene13674-16102_t
MKMEESNQSTMPTTQVVDDCNVFVKYLPCEYTEKDLFNLFQPHGSIVNIKVMVNTKTGSSLGYGFVRYADPSDALEAINKMNRLQIGYKTLLCKLSKPSQTPIINPNQHAEDQEPREPSPCLYVRVLSPTITDAILKSAFEPFGEVLESQVLIDTASGKSKRSGYIRFPTIQMASHAIHFMNGSLQLGDTPLTVRYASSKIKSTSGNTSPVTVQQQPQQFEQHPYTYLYATEHPYYQSQQEQFPIYHHYPTYAFNEQYSPRGSPPSSPCSSPSYSPISHQASTYATAPYYIYSTPAAYYPSASHAQPIYFQSPSASATTSPSSSPPLSSIHSSFSSFSTVSSPAANHNNNNNNNNDTNNNTTTRTLICTYRHEIEFSELYQVFSRFGSLKSLKINTAQSFNNKLKSYVSFVSSEACMMALHGLDRSKVGNQQIRVKIQPELKL